MSQRPNFDIQQTPSRMTFIPPPKMVSPKKNPALKSPSKPKMLPGFQNSFTTSTPLKSRSKGKEKEKERIVDDGNVFDGPPLLSQPLSRLFPTLPKPTQNERPPPEPSFRPSSPPPVVPVFESQPQTFEVDGDIVMGTETPQEELEEEYDAIEAPNWKAEVSDYFVCQSWTICSLSCLALPYSFNACTTGLLPAVFPAAPLCCFQWRRRGGRL